jgi:hypothetical protein
MFSPYIGKEELLNPIWPACWEKLLCGQRLSNTRSLVDLTNLIGENLVEVRKWQASLAAKWISDASRISAVLEAHGQLRVLQNGPAISSADQQHSNVLFAHGMIEFWSRVLDGLPILYLRPRLSRHADICPSRNCCFFMGALPLVVMMPSLLFVQFVSDLTERHHDIKKYLEKEAIH